MASWRDLTLAGLVLWISACTVTAADSLPMRQAENAAVSQARAGLVRSEAGVLASPAATLVAIEAAVRADAAAAWELAEGKRVQVSAEEVTWTDGSLGCPQPGMAYTQALVAGWRLVARGNGHEAVYHASRRGQWLWCPSERLRAPLAGEATR